ETPDLLNCLWRFPLQYIINLPWINRNTSISDDMPKERDLLQPEITLAEFSIQLMLSKLLQHKPQVLLMLLLILGVNQDIINEHHNKLIQILHKHLVHQ